LALSLTAGDIFLLDLKMPVAILDPFAGVSGDMLLGALVDAGAPPAWLVALPARLGFDGVAVTVSRVTRAALSATKVDVVVGEGHADDTHLHLHATGSNGGHNHGHHVAELLERVRAAPVSPWVRERAVRTFELLAAAEARVHGTTVDEVHLHEVGATDAVIDIVGVIEGFEQLGVQDVYHLPIAVGTGWVAAAHGALPVPAPATAALLEGQDVVMGGPVTGEAATPTGAALLRVLSQGPPPARWRLLRSGWGAGTRNPTGYPNALRLLVAEPAIEAGVVEVVATDVDDLSPEYVEAVRTAVRAAGAVECYTWAIHGKKGRMAVRFEALAATDCADAVARALLRHSTTAGIRRTHATRMTLPREELMLELTGGHRVRVKVWRGPDGPRWKAEFDDVAAVAERLGKPAWEVAREAEARAAALVQNHTEEEHA
jgi:uncharacterized protein (TIGR00299 family) protein